MPTVTCSLNRIVREAAARSQIRSHGVVAALALASAATAQTKVLDGSSWPITTGSFAQALEIAGVQVPPESVWRCHGAYLETILNNDDESRATARTLGLDGIRYEKPEATRRGVALVRRGIAVQEQAIDELVRCVGESVQEDDRAKLPLVAAELKARILANAASEYAPTYDYGPYQIPSAARMTSGLPLDADERERVNAIVLDRAVARAHAARAMLESGLEQRLRRAELAESAGVTGMTMQEASDRMNARRRELVAAHNQAVNRGERPATIVDPGMELNRATHVSAEPLHAALLSTRDTYGAVAAALPPAHAKLIRRRFLEDVMGLKDGHAATVWGVERPLTPDPCWTARTLLTRSDISAAQRAEARAILNAWVEALDAWKEQKAEALIDGLRADDAAARLPRHPFDHMNARIEELADLAAPYQERLATALDMPWIIDDSLALPAPAGPEGIDLLEGEDLLLTGDASSMRRSQEIHIEYWATIRTGWSRLETADVEGWCALAECDGSLREQLSGIVAAHQAAWDEVIAPIAARVTEPQPPRPGVLVTREGESDPIITKIQEWHGRVRQAAEELDTAARAWEQKLIESLRAPLRAGDPDRAWVLDAIEFRRAAERVRSLDLGFVKPVLYVMDEEAFGGRRLDPIEVVLQSGISREAQRAAVRAMMPAVDTLREQLREEDMLQSTLIREMESPFVPGDFAEKSARALPTAQRLLTIRAAWRTVERDALERAKAVVAEADRARIDRTALRKRFPSAFTVAEEIAARAADVRKALEQEADVAYRLESIALVDAAEESALTQIERRAAPIVAEFSVPAPSKLESLEQHSEDRNARRLRANDASSAPRLESGRFTWYLVNALPPEIVMKSDSLLRHARRSGIPLPATRNEAGHAGDSKE